MNQLSKVELQVKPSTAAALADSHRREAVSRLVDRLVRPGINAPLIAFLDRIAAEAPASSLTQADTEADPAAHKATTTPPHTAQRIRLTREGVLQTVYIPHAFELPGKTTPLSPPTPSP